MSATTNVEASRSSPGTGDAFCVLLTKFNVLLRGHGDQPVGLDPGWLERRIELFEAWTLRSVRGQTVPPALWLVFVNADTSPRFVARLTELCGDSASIVPVKGTLTDERIAHLVHAVVPANAATLVTARLDNDDAISERYVATVGGEALSWRGFVNPRNGLQLVGSRVLRCWDRSSPFLSLIEDRDPLRPPRTVFCVEHQRAAGAGPVRQLGGPPLWLQVVHAGNLANEARGVPYPRSRANRSLGLALPTVAPAPAPRAIVGAVAAQALHELRWIAARGRPRR